MTGGLKVGPVYLDGADYGQKRCQPISNDDLARLMADARLLAAAPDLLEALWQCLGSLKALGAENGYAADAARAAIAKAEGRS